MRLNLSITLYVCEINKQTMVFKKVFIQMHIPLSVPHKRVPSHYSMKDRQKKKKKSTDDPDMAAYSMHYDS